MIEHISVTIRPDKQLPFSQEELLDICGLFGIHPEPTAPDQIIVEINPYVDCVRININSIAVSNLQVLIYQRISISKTNSCGRGSLAAALARGG